MDFTYTAYKKMITALKNADYKICSYEEIMNCTKGAILRHDIDFDLEKALEIARMENSLGVS